MSDNTPLVIESGCEPFLADELKDFLVSDDRSLNPFFTGREDLRAEINYLSGVISKEQLSKLHRDPADGSTVIIQGPPGIGKTSLLAKIRQECIAKLNRNEGKTKTIPVMIKNSANLSYENVGRNFQKAIEDIQPLLNDGKIKDKITGTLNSVSSVSVFGLGVGFHQRSTVEDRLDPGEYTILLLIDEIQAIPRGPETDAGKLLTWLHTGNDGHPILPILAGMPNSVTALAECGIYRLKVDAVKNLKPLTDDEVKTSFVKFIEKFNITTEPALTNTWANGIVRLVDGWPKHLHNTMKALGTEILAVDGDLRRVDPTRVWHQAMEYRLAYYETGFLTFTVKPSIIGEVMAGLGTGTSKEKIMDLISQVKSRHKLDQMASLGFEELLRKGFISPYGPPVRLRYHCPIPSMQSYAVAKTGSELHGAAYAGSEEVVRHCLTDGEDINGSDAWGRTPLHLAVSGDWPKVVQLLLVAGADPSIQDKYDHTPIDLARPDSSVATQLTNLA